jgi:phosphoribosylamine--glycine ligase
LQGNQAKVIEFNVRFGDPETQVLLPRFKGDLAELLLAATNGKMENVKWEMSDLSAVHVVLSSKGYPSSNMQLRETISVDNDLKDVDVFYSGVSRDFAGKLINSSGRVLGVTALAKDLKDARVKVYEAIKKINFNGAHWRTDIGKTDY